MLKRIFAVIGDNEFYAFRRQCDKDGVDMGQALASLAKLYADAKVSLKGERTTVKKVAQNFYVNVHQSEIKHE